MTTDTTYNGWSNYETWCVNLWLDNEPEMYNTKRHIIRRAGDKNEAADHLESWASDMLPDLGASFASDLLTAAFQEVNFREIVESEWDELHADDEPEEDDEDSTGGPDVQSAIDESIIKDTTVRIGARLDSQEWVALADRLAQLCTDYRENFERVGASREYWGTDDDGDEWRIILVGE